MLLMLDEFTSLGKLSIVERAIAYMAGYGVKGYFIVQPEFYRKI
jgi:type IV secretion system protein VirD4